MPITNNPWLINSNHDKQAAVNERHNSNNHPLDHQIQLQHKEKISELQYQKLIHNLANTQLQQIPKVHKTIRT